MNLPERNRGVTGDRASGHGGVGRWRVGMLVLAASLLTLAPLCAAAQGAGTTGAQVLQFVAGSRASALSGAYTAASSDADVLFYNPAGAATLRLAASLSYETFVEEIAFASFSGAFRLGTATVGLSGVFFDAGTVRELVPDPIFGGNSGTPTGNLVAAAEGVAKLSVGMPFGDRLRLGASAGFLSSSIADESRGAPVFDLGAQYDLAHVTLGAALRNFGGAVTGDASADASLPTEARLGAVADLTRADGLGVRLHGDLVARLHESTTGFVFGAEGGYHANAQRSVGAVARVGLSGNEGDGAIGALRLGGGITMANLAIDYTYQDVEFFGAVHRFGLRWTVAR